MKILIVDDETDVREIVSFTVETEIKADIIEAISGDEAIEALRVDEDIDLIFCDYNMSSGNGGKVYQYLLRNEKNIPFVLCSTDSARAHTEFEDRKFLLGEIKKPNIFQGVQEIFSVYESENTLLERSDSEFCEAAISLVAHSKNLPCDIYIKVGSTPIKAYKKGFAFTDEDLAKYQAKKLKSLLIKREDTKEFIDNISNNIINILEDTSRTDEDKVISSHDLVMQTVGQLGINESVKRAATKSVQYTLKYFQQQKELGNYQRILFTSDTENYLTFHSVGVGYVAIGLLRQDSIWDSPENRDKLIMAGFLHDMSIARNNVVESIFDKNSQLLDHKQHPEDTAKLLKSLSNIPEDVFKIINEHHERPDGSGFPRGLTAASLSPLTSVFIFSHDIVDAVFDLRLRNQEVSTDAILNILDHDLYNQGHFKKCLKYLKSSNLF